MTLLEAQAIAWPPENATTYSYKGKGRDRARFYLNAAEGWEWPGVTTILSAWDKGGLIKWAADKEREAVIEAAVQVFHEDQKSEEKRRITNAKGFRWKLVRALPKVRKHEELKEEGGFIGTHVHEQIRWRLRREMGFDEPVPEVPPQFQQPVALASMHWHEHWIKRKLRPVRIEQVVWSRTHKIAGTLDLLALDEYDRLGICDWKSSKSIRSSNHMQVACYSGFTEEMTGLKIEWGELWRPPKTIKDLHLIVAPLGEYEIWNGGGFEPKKESREELFQSFLGIARAWNCTMRPL